MRMRANHDALALLAGRWCPPALPAGGVLGADSHQRDSAAGGSAGHLLLAAAAGSAQAAGPVWSLPEWLWLGRLLACIGLGLTLLSVLFSARHWLLYYPLAVSLALLCLFGWSLTRPMSLVERLARLQDPRLPDVAIGYTRRVTQIWCGFFVVNGALAAFTIWYGDLALWSLYNGLISYGLMGALMAGEYLVRRRLMKRLVS